MAPGITSDDLPIREGSSNGKTSSYPEPLKLSGALEKFEREDVTPVIPCTRKKVHGRYLLTLLR
jgi:hypothetical protein